VSRPPDGQLQKSMEGLWEKSRGTSELYETDSMLPRQDVGDVIGKHTVILLRLEKSKIDTGFCTN